MGTNPTLKFWKKEENFLANIEEKVEKLLKPTIENIGYDLYDVEYTKEGKNYFLRIYIDKPEGIDLKDCETVNDAISDLLDEANYIKEQYFLEVSSPGIERVLRKDKHLEQNKGKEIAIKLFKKDTLGNKEYEGTLKDFDEEYILLEEDIKIERKSIAQIRTVYDWDWKIITILDYIKFHLKRGYIQMYAPLPFKWNVFLSNKKIVFLYLTKKTKLHRKIA